MTEVDGVRLEGMLKVIIFIITGVNESIEMTLSAFVDLALRANELTAVEEMVERGVNECKILPRLKPLTFLASTYAKHSIPTSIIN